MAAISEPSLNKKPDEDSTPLPSSDASLDEASPSKSNDVDQASQHDTDAGVKITSTPTNPRLSALQAKKANLEATLATLQAQKSALVAEAKLPSGLAMPEIWSEEEKTKSALATANGIIKDHIALLHKYNEIKDIGQGLMGLIADSRSVRIASVMEEFGMTEKD